MRCPRCGSHDVECIPKQPRRGKRPATAHIHQCHDCHKVDAWAN